LWFNIFIDDAFNLLTLAIEKIAKLLLMQNEQIPGKDLNEKFDYVDNFAIKINKTHELHKIIPKIETEYNINLIRFNDTINKIDEFYKKRYPENKESMVDINLLNSIDELYFLLRSYIKSDIPICLIDEIYSQKKLMLPHSIPSFAYAYYKNNSFKGRKHPLVKYFDQNNPSITWSEDGS
jgi:hypothetical protein